METKNNETIAEVLRELQDYVLVRKTDYANMLCAYKKYHMDKEALENRLRAEFEAEMYQNRIEVLEDKISQLKKKNLKWWQKIF